MRRLGSAVTAVMLASARSAGCWAAWPAWSISARLGPGLGELAARGGELLRLHD